MRNLIDDIGSVKHNLSQKIKASVTDKASMLEINGHQLYLEDTISEGGYGFIIRCTDRSTGKKFVLKKSVCPNEERKQVAMAECQFLDTSHIVKCFGVKQVRQDNSDVFYCLLEYMPEGSLFDLMERKQAVQFDEAQCLRIFRQICQGIQVMHHMDPPLAHRDLKIENVLFDGGNFKLCDFGSVSSSSVDFKLVPKEDYPYKMEEFDKKTTITYRPPEMCDPYLQLCVDTKADIWMLGCILFALAFYKHPFQECTTLSIVNASYFMPLKHKFSPKFENLIRNLLTPDPALRYDIDQVLSILDNWETAEVELNRQAQAVKNEHMKKQNIWNEDAWSKINKGEFNSGGFLEQKKNGERDFSSKAIQAEQFRAEFSDFNVDGLRKFQDSQKYAVKNPLLNHKREMDFELGTNQNSLANDFLNWDMKPEPQKGPIVASENVEEFSQFNFSSAHKPSTVPNDEFFNVSVSPQHINSSSAGPGQNFWDEFGENPSQTPGKSVDPFSETHPACLNDKKISNEMLLKLSLDPDEKEELEIVEESKPVEEQPQQSTSTKEPNSFLDIELN